MLDLKALVVARLRSIRNQRLSRAEFENRRLQRFRRFAVFVRDRSPYYSRIMRERGIDASRSTPQDFPELTKTELVRDFDNVVTDRSLKLADVHEFLHSSKDPQTLMRGRYVVVHTSGSSGEVGYFVYDLSSWASASAALLHGSEFQLLSLRRKRMAFFGATEGHFAGVSITMAANMFPLSLQYASRAFEVNRPLSDAVVGLNEWQPHVLLGYGTALKALAEKSLAGELRIRPQALYNSGEPLIEADRRVLEQAFGNCVRNTYTCSEHLFMATKDPDWQSMRLLEDDLIFEFFPDHITVTNLFNHTLPLIRYRMNDVLVPLASDEHAPYLAIAEVVGRVEQLAKFTNRHGQSDGISPHTINEILIPHVKRFQMRLRGPEFFTFLVVLDSYISDVQRHECLQAAHETLRGILEQKAMQNVSFEVVPTDDLLIDSKTGKFRLIVPDYRN